LILRQLPEGLLLQQTQIYHVAQLEVLQKIVFPSLAADELLKAIHYLKHIELFPEGQLVITHGERVVGMTTTMRSNFDFDHCQHTFKETIAGGWMTNHNPNGEWLYGLDIGIHPDYRRKGLARYLYEARQQLAEKLGLRGQLTVGLLNGYGAVQHIITANEYYQELLENKRTDPTITPQMKMGFKPIALIPDYVHDPTCANYGVLMSWKVN
jgi:GNAT superfamily N-acetyltransferase